MSADKPSERTELLELIFGVEGYLYEGEAWELYRRTKAVGAAALIEGRQPVVVEIGSHKGRSTIPLAHGLRTAGGGQVHAIDPYTNGDRRSEFLDNVARVGLSDYVHPVRLTSHEARRDFSSSLELLFVDGSHTLEAVLQDIADWTPLVRSGGTAAFNDPSWPGVYAALRQKVFVKGSMFRHPVLVDNTVFFEVRRETPWTDSDTVALRRLRVGLAIRKLLTPLRRYTPDGTARFGRAAFQRIVSSYNAEESRPGE